MWSLGLQPSSHACIHVYVYIYSILLPSYLCMCLLQAYYYVCMYMTPNKTGSFYWCVVFLYHCVVCVLENFRDFEQHGMLMATLPVRKAGSGVAVADGATGRAACIATPMSILEWNSGVLLLPAAATTPPTQTLYALLLFIASPTLYTFYSTFAFCLAEKLCVITLLCK